MKELGESKKSCSADSSLFQQGNYKFGPIFHIGLPKTGTSFIQERFLPSLGLKNYSTHRRMIPRSLRWIYAINGRWVNERLPRHELQARLKEIAEREICITKELTANPAILSAEGLCGVSHDPLLNSESIASKLAELYPDGRVILCVRKHAEWCASIYQQLVIHEDRFGHFIPFNQLFSTSKTDKAIVKVANLKWAKLCEHWLKAFGHDRVLILRYEELLSDPVRFLSRISRFSVGIERATIDTNERINYSAGRHQYNQTPIILKILRLVSALCLTDIPRARWEARTLKLAVADRHRPQRIFLGLDEATRLRIEKCTENDCKHLNELIALNQHIHDT